MEKENREIGIHGVLLFPPRPLILDEHYGRMKKES